MFTSVDHEKFRANRITHVATRIEQLISDEGNDELTPEQLFSTAVDDALDARRAARIDKLIRQAGFPIPPAATAEIDYREGRGINPSRMRRYGAHDWRTEPTNLLVISPTGAGKTYLACAIGIAACHSHALTEWSGDAHGSVAPEGDRTLGGDPHRPVGVVFGVHRADPRGRRFVNGLASCPAACQVVGNAREAAHHFIPRETTSPPTAESVDTVAWAQGSTEGV
jgi:hypothetical protein